MITIEEKDRSPKCLVCKLRCTKIVSLTDDGMGKRMCIKCKRKYKQKHLNKDYKRNNHERNS